MLVVNGFFESGVFVPERPLANIKGRQRASLYIVQENENDVRLKAWKEFSLSIKTSNEELEGEPVRLRFKNPEEINDL